ncbi:MAG: SpoIIE family protein phosphatase, partial [Clostridia bacterium]|nr:SpoIIE family protein phosphatase [Clostridia bacterium]
MSDTPRIYPFKRPAEGVAAKPVFAAARKSGAITLAQALRFILIAFAAFLLSRAGILGGLYPFAAPVLAAALVTYPKKGALLIIPVLIGLYTAMEGRILLVYAAIMVLLTAIFLLYNVDSKKQWFVVPGMVVAAMLVSKGLLMALTVFTDYQLIVSIFESLIAGGLSIVFLVIFTALRRFDVARRFSADEMVCIFLAGIGVICGLNGVSIGILDLQSLLSRFIIMMAAFLGGPGAGAALGALIGIVPSIAQVIAPSVIATYAFSGMLAGIFANFGRIGTAIGFILGNMILALYMLNSAEISANLLASAAAALVFFLIPVKYSRKLGRAFSATGLRSAKEEKSERLLMLALRKLRNTGWLFRDLSKSMDELSSSESLSEEDSVRASLDQLSHQLCSRCSMRDICWEMDYAQTLRGIVSLFETVQESGAVELKDAPENFAKRCPHIKELIATVNCLYDMQCRTNYWRLQRQSSSKLISSQLAGVSDLMEKIARDISDFGDEREILERELEKSIAKRGMPVDSAGIISLSDKSVGVWAQFIECPGELYCRQAIEEEVSRLLGCEFRVHEAICGGKDCSCRCNYQLLAAGAHTLTLGQAQLAKDGKSVNGDTGSTILLDDGRQLLMISDGMGSGSKAAAESSAAISLISRLLEAGFQQSTAIDMLNAVLALRGDAADFVTLDICVVGLYDGKVDFIKTGGSSSYIKRGGTVKVINGSSLPVGMLTSVE